MNLVLFFAKSGLILVCFFQESGLFWVCFLSAFCVRFILATLQPLEKTFITISSILESTWEPSWNEQYPVMDIWKTLSYINTLFRIFQNDFGRMKAGTQMIYWVSFLDGIQRVLLFTDNFKASYYASQEHILRANQEVNICIESVGKEPSQNSCLFIFIRYFKELKYLEVIPE